MKQYFFVDEAEVSVIGGSGGEGAFSFYHFRNGHVQGDGGNGGRGGDVFFVVHTGIYDLTKLKQKRTFTAAPGSRASSNNKTGRDAEPLLVEVPLGTLIRDSKDALLFDLDDKDSRFLAAHGGLGGHGNYKKAKDFFSTPRKGEEVTFHLDLRIPNDIALVGPPNTGKTTLINLLSGKEMKVSQFPFTTTLPIWAPAEYDFRKFTCMELPAMIRPAKYEAVNEQFLKHLYRSKAIVIVSDAGRKYKEDFSFMLDRLKQSLGDEYKKKKIGFLVNKSDVKSKAGVAKEGRATFCSAQNPKHTKAIFKYFTALL